ncbi:MAG: T9SS type A sorting domain-containing protein [Bacteroidia bacterium]
MAKNQFQSARVLLLAAFTKISPIAFSLLLFFNQSFAQPVNAYFDPPEFENGDKIELVIEYGSPDDPVQNALTAHFEIAYDGFEIDESSKLSVDASGASWFGWDEAYTGRITVNHTLHVITVDLERDESPVSGEGFIARGSGVTVFIEEINAKRSPSLNVVEVNYAFPAPQSLYYDALNNILNITLSETNHFIQIDVFDLSGRVIYSSQTLEEELPMSHFPANIYFVRLRTALGVENLKLIVSP